MIAAATHALARVGSAAWGRIQLATISAALNASKESGRGKKITNYPEKNRSLNVTLNTGPSNLTAITINIKTRVVQVGEPSRI
jgi:hypothetical protein